MKEQLRNIFYSNVKLSPYSEIDAERRLDEAVALFSQELEEAETKAAYNAVLDALDEVGSVSHDSIYGTISEIRDKWHKVYEDMEAQKGKKV